MNSKTEVIKCWYEKATDLYLITPAWWDEKANTLYFPGRKLVLCKAPALTADIRRLSERMMKEHYNVWMDAETYLEQTEARMKKEDEALHSSICRTLEDSKHPRVIHLPRRFWK